MKTVRTQTGSIYELDEDKKQIRAVKRSGVHRIEEGWKPYEKVELKVGRSMIVYWGSGRDEYSDNATTIGAEDPLAHDPDLGGRLDREDMTPRERYRRARLAGASCSLDVERWAAVVDKAAEIGEEKYESYKIAEPEVPRTYKPRRCEMMTPDCVAVPAQTILDLEARFSEMEMEIAAIRELAESHELAEALRERLRNRLQQVRDDLRRRIERDEIKN